MVCVVDLFAGGGGASTGISQALGQPVTIAVEWSPKILAIHKVNHPETRHILGDLRLLDPQSILQGQPVDLLWGSPPCTQFSSSNPLKKGMDTSSMAWAVYRWIASCTPKVFILENVPAFTHWRDLQLLQDRLRHLGYHLSEGILEASRFGSLALRKRYYLMGSLKGGIQLPRPTHGPGTPNPCNSGRMALDLGLPLRTPNPGVRSAQWFHKMSRVHGWRGTTKSFRGEIRRLDLPFYCLLAHGSNYGIAHSSPQGVYCRDLTPQELLALAGFPDHYRLPKEKNLTQLFCGNSVHPRMAQILTAQAQHHILGGTP